jgi:hypothetical protein
VVGAIVSVGDAVQELVTETIIVLKASVAEPVKLDFSYCWDSSSGVAIATVGYWIGGEGSVEIGAGGGECEPVVGTITDDGAGGIWVTAPGKFVVTYPVRYSVITVTVADWAIPADGAIVVCQDNISTEYSLSLSSCG